MAFELTLVPEDLANLEVLTVGSEHSILLRVGRNPDGSNYFMLVGLSPQPPDSLLEFYFHMIEVVADGAEYPVWDAQVIAALVPAEDRLKILVAVGVMARRLIEGVNPERFVMTMHDPSPPEKAMRKYHLLNHVFGSCGFRVTKCNPYNGIVSWWLDRMG